MEKRFWLVLLCAVIPSWFVVGQEIEDFVVEQNSVGGIAIMGYNGSVTDIVIPDEMYGIKVTGIGDRVFSRKNLTSVKLPRYLGYIGEEAFRGNKLTKVELPDALSGIDNDAFKDNELTDVVWGTGVQGIYNEAFSNNKLTSITNMSPKLVEVGSSAFSGNPITHIVLPDSLVTLTGDAFSECPVQSITFGTGMTFCGTGLINPTNLTEVVVRKYPINWRRYSGKFEGGADGPIINDAGFASYFVSQGKKPGRYTKTGPIWTRSN